MIVYRPTYKSKLIVNIERIGVIKNVYKIGTATEVLQHFS